MKIDQTLPQELQEILASYTPLQNEIGCSAATVYCYQKPGDTLYLKIQKTNDEIQAEHVVLSWAAGRLPVPAVRFYQEFQGYSYLLTTAVRGYMSFMDERGRMFSKPENAVSALSKGLLALQAVDIRDSPFDKRLSTKLEQARRRVEQGLVETEDFEENNPFSTAEDLYEYLFSNKPDEDLCFTHGDYCLPNIFMEGDRLTGFIDMGRAGIADKWQDIALCVRSLGYNLRGIGDKDHYVSLLFDKLGIQPDEEKIRYYILLDDLF